MSCCASGAQRTTDDRRRPRQEVDGPGKGIDMGSIFRPTYRAANGTRRAAAVWWLKYRAQGRVVRQASGTDNAQEARCILKIREGKATEGQPVMPRADKITVDALLDTLKADYQANGRRSLDR